MSRTIYIYIVICVKRTQKSVQFLLPLCLNIELMIIIAILLISRLQSRLNRHIIRPKTESIRFSTRLDLCTKPASNREINDKPSLFGSIRNKGSLLNQRRLIEHLINPPRYYGLCSFINPDRSRFETLK